MSTLFPNQPTDDEYLSQCDPDIFDLASDGITLAINIVRFMEHHNSSKHFADDLENPYLKQALQFLHRYADWRQIDMPTAYKQALEAQV